MKKIIILCDLGVGGERGRVLDRKGIATSVTATEYKDPLKTIKKWERKKSLFLVQ
jgi:hypothetical protein